jgi:hypothetical protein
MPVKKLFDVGQREVIFFIYVSYLTKNKTRFSFYNFKEVQNKKVNKLVIDSTITKSCTFYDVCLFFSSLSIVSIFVYVEKI